MKLTVYATLKDDLGEGFVWLKDPALPPRCVVKMTNPVTKQSVFVEALQIEDNFLCLYKESPRTKNIIKPNESIVISGWYRARLGDISTQEECDLDIKKANGYYGKIRMCMYHPQTVVRVAVWLGILSSVLGLVGVVIGLITLWPAFISLCPTSRVH